MKTLISALALLLFTSTAQAGLYVGPSVGGRMNMATTDQTGVSIGSAFGTQYGALILWGFTDMLMLRTGVLFAQKNLNATASGSTFNTTINYLDIPIALQWGMPVMPLYVWGGIKFGNKMSDSCTASGFLTSCGGMFTVSTSNTMANLGIGYDLFDAKVSKLSLEVEYELGMVNVNTNPATGKSTVGGVAANLVWIFGF